MIANATNRHRNHRVYIILGIALSLCFAAAPSIAQTTFLSMVSDGVGDWIGQGYSYFYTDAMATFTATHENGENHIEISVIEPSFAFWWYLDFAAPAGQSLTVGTYTGCTRYPFNAPDEPGLDVSGMGRGCNTLTGNFTIHEVTYDPSGEVLVLRATFEQHCEGVAAALWGDIRINSTFSTPTAEFSWGAVKSIYTDQEIRKPLINN